MRDIKDTKQATVRIGYDGTVHKYFNGTMALERFKNERRVLQYLEHKNCGFVPSILDSDESKIYLKMTNCGQIVTRISAQKVERLFQELQTYGVRHEDPYARNITYDAKKGRFCIIDFEFATILETGEGLTLDHPGFENRFQLE